jgi:hypothetical protein
LFSDARWKIPVTYPIVEVLDLTFAESTNINEKQLYEKVIENLPIQIHVVFLIV